MTHLQSINLNKIINNNNKNFYYLFKHKIKKKMQILTKLHNNNSSIKCFHRLLFENKKIMMI